MSEKTWIRATKSNRVGSSRKGSALIVAFGILVLMVLMGVSLFVVSKSERGTSANYVDKVQARILAQAGIEKAYGIIYRGLKSYNPAKLSDYSAAEGGGEEYFYGRRPTPSNAFTLNQSEVPLDRAYWVSASQLNSSKGADLDKNNNWSVKISNIGKNETGTDGEDNDNDGSIDDPDEGGNVKKRFGVSGVLPSSYGGGMDYYALKVTPTAGKVYINGPDKDPLDNKVQGLADNQILLLNNLGSILFNKGIISFSNLGDRINQVRVNTGSDIVPVDSIKGTSAFSGVPDTEIDRLKSYITSQTWVDRSTLHPDALKHPRDNDPNLVYDRWFNYVRGEGLDGGNDYGPGFQPPSRRMLLGSCAMDRIMSHDVGIFASSENLHSRGTNNTETPVTSDYKIGDVRQPRAPININAAPKETIQAVLMNIEAYYLNRYSSEPAHQIYPDVKQNHLPKNFLGKGYTKRYTVKVDKILAGQIAQKLIDRRQELINARGFGFSTYEDLNHFIYALNDGSELSSLDPPSSISPLKPASNDWGVSSGGGIDSPRKGNQVLALQQAIIANINPNSRLPNSNPNFSMGIRFGDTCKADLLEYTTEFSFASNGYFRVQSLGRVLGPETVSGDGHPLVAEAQLSTIVKIYDTYRISTQEEFYKNRDKGKTGVGKHQNIQYYPENLKDLNWDENRAAAYDGYLEIPTTDWSQGSSNSRITYNDTLAPEREGPAEENVRLINPNRGGRPDGPGNGMSELFNDGVFQHDSRRYKSRGGGGLSAYRKMLKYGAKNFNDSIDDFVRHERLDNLVTDPDVGGIGLWVKPTWFGNEFPGKRSTWARLRQPHSEGTRTLFSFGDGSYASTTPGPPYPCASGWGYSDQSGSDRRASVFVRNQRGRIVLFGFNKSRLTRAWPHDDPGDPPHLLNPVSSVIPHDDIWPTFGYFQSTSYDLSKRMVKPKDPYIASEKQADSWYSPGRWHFIGIQWKRASSYSASTGLETTGQQGGKSQLIVDGNATPWTPAFAHKAFQMLSGWSFFTGSNRFEQNEVNGFPLIADATIDDIRFHNGNLPFSAGFPPHRYLQKGTYHGEIGPADKSDPVLDGPMNYSGEILNVSWTAYLPRRNRNWTDVRVFLSGKGWTHQVPNNPPGDAFNGRGLPVLDKSNNPATFNAGNQLRYRVELVSNGSWRVETPIFDSITVRVSPGSPQFEYYGWED